MAWPHLATGDDILTEFDRQISRVSLLPAASGIWLAEDSVHTVSRQRVVWRPGAMARPLETEEVLEAIRREKISENSLRASSVRRPPLVDAIRATQNSHSRGDHRVAAESDAGRGRRETFCYPG